MAQYGKTIRALLIVGLMMSMFLTSNGLLQVESARPEEQSSTTLDYNYYLPMAFQAPDGAIIIDHRHTNITQIPAYWIEQAKSLTLHYAHTSHGSQLLSGAQYWESQNSTYNIDIKTGGDPGLPSDTTALRIYDGNNYGSDTYITPEKYWSEAAGQDKTRSVVGTGLFNISTWTWCGQQTTNSEATVQYYLDTLNQFESEYPAVLFIYMTGHTEAPYASQTVLKRNNDMVRDYANNNQKILFDFADIERYYPDGTPVDDSLVDDSCPWCQAWCSAHPSDCSTLPSSCAHADASTYSRFLCKLKGAAFWWMMARIAGWDGTP